MLVTGTPCKCKVQGWGLQGGGRQLLECKCGSKRYSPTTGGSWQRLQTTDSPGCKQWITHNDGRDINTAKHASMCQAPWAALTLCMVLFTSGNPLGDRSDSHMMLCIWHWGVERDGICIRQIRVSCQSRHLSSRLLIGISSE